MQRTENQAVRPLDARRPAPYIATVAALLLSLLTLAACSRQPAPRAETAGHQDVNDVATEVATPLQATRAATPRDGVAVAPEDVPGELLKQSWQSHYIQGNRVGYGHLRTDRMDGGRIRTVHRTELELQRFGHTVAQQMTLRTYETEDGQLQQFHTELSDSSNRTVTQGQVTDGQLVIETSTLGPGQTAGIPWDSSVGGFFAVEQSLQQNPMQPGEQRSLRCLQPLYHVVANVRLEAKRFETTDLPGGSRELLRIESVMDLAGTPVQSVLWTDREGEVWKTSMPAMQQTSYRTTQQEAMETKPDGSFDFGSFSVVRIDQRIENAHGRDSLVYRIALRDGDPATAFAESPRQSIESIDERTARIVTQGWRTAEHVTGANDQPTDADRRPNSLIQSDDELVVQMAHEVLPDEQDPRRLAVALEQYVHHAITEKTFSQAFATAAEVARDREGDCTEHSVLLAALCRARGIPARVAIGLVYYDAADQPAFAYHMWTEAWVDGGWLPLDATLALGGIGPAHLKLDASNLDGVDAYAAFLPVVRVMNQLEIEVEVP